MRQVTVWDPRTGQELVARKEGGNLAAFSPDGKLMATGSVGGFARGNGLLPPQQVPPKVTVRDAQTGKELYTLDTPVFSLAFSPDGHRLAIGSGNRPGQGQQASGEVKVYDSQRGQELVTLPGHSGRVTRMAFSPDGRHLASASFDYWVKVWDAKTGKSERRVVKP
jgi:WD40 repeat protein